jgi:hypothetical protein
MLPPASNRRSHCRLPILSSAGRSSAQRPLQVHSCAPRKAKETKPAEGLRPWRATRGNPQSSALCLCRPPLRYAPSTPLQGWGTPPLALAAPAGVGQGQGVSVRTATAKPLKSQGATNMSNDRAQELTAKINQSITALCAETDAAKQSDTYLAWLSTVSRFYKYSFGNCLLIWSQRAVT